MLSACIASIMPTGGKDRGKEREGEEKREDSMFIHTNKYINVLRR